MKKKNQKRCTWGLERPPGMSEIEFVRAVLSGGITSTFPDPPRKKVK